MVVIAHPAAAPPPAAIGHTIAGRAEAWRRARLAGVVLITRDTTGWSRPSPKGENGEGRNSNPSRLSPGSLPLEAALRNCRGTLRQASERRDPGMTGALM